MSRVRGVVPAPLETTLKFWNLLFQNEQLGYHLGSGEVLTDASLI